ncbi:MAG: FecR family protein [Archangium sp.]|nr:FecR family protein [Archangium sp.]MDP3156450.1 FecR family protein [Archangium sp.]MDP3573104.1 FecR family protein [Archangium sp.]
MNRPVDERVARALSPQPVAEEVPLTDAETELAIDLVAAALAARRPVAPEAPARIPARRPRVVWGALAAAGLLGGLVAALVLSRGGPEAPQAQVLEAGLATATTGQGTRVVADGDALGAGARLKTPHEGHLRLGFAEGTQLWLGEKTDVRVEKLGLERRFALVEGRLSASVIKLKTGERFVIETARAEVEVKGTQFQVDAQAATEGCPAGQTVVSVEEGVVAVRAEGVEVLVKAGERHAVGCPPSVQVEPDAVAPQLRKKRRSVPPASSSLAKMNAQYARAMALKREGRPLAAAKALRAMREAFPMGPLDEAAAVEELRLLEQVDLPAARAAAKAYLLEYPDGYADDIANRLVAP